MCLLCLSPVVLGISIHFLGSHLKAHLLSTYYVPGAILGPGDRAEIRNPCPYRAYGLLLLRLEKAKNFKVCNEESHSTFFLGVP